MSFFSCLFLYLSGAIYCYLLFSWLFCLHQIRAGPGAQKKQLINGVLKCLKNTALPSLGGCEQRQNWGLSKLIGHNLTFLRFIFKILKGKFGSLQLWWNSKRVAVKIEFGSEGQMFFQSRLFSKNLFFEFINCNALGQ